MFILNVFGPAYKYRLDILADACPTITHLMYVLTDKVSYTKFYQEYKDTFTFVFIEDLREQYPDSIRLEILPTHFETEEQQFRELESFYKENNTFYSYDIHRFAFPFFISKGITKFFILDSDCIPVNNLDRIHTFFSLLPEKAIFASGMGHLQVESNWETSPKQKFWRELGHPLYSSQFNLNKAIPYSDGWVRGFNFSSVTDMQEFFDLWNLAYLKLLDMKRLNQIELGKNGEGPIIWSTEWLFNHVVQIFEEFKGYAMNGDFTMQPGIVHFNGTVVARHSPRPEDNLFYTFNGRRGAWWDFTFDYGSGDVKTVSEFVKRNKMELERYYKYCQFEQVEITDTHAYTRTSL